MKIISLLGFSILFISVSFGQVNKVKAELHFVLFYGKAKMGYEREMFKKQTLGLDFETAYTWNPSGNTFIANSVSLGYNFYFNKHNQASLEGISLGVFGLFGKSIKDTDPSGDDVNHYYRDYGLGLSFCWPITDFNYRGFRMQFGFNLSGIIKEQFATTILGNDSITLHKVQLDQYLYEYAFRFRPVFGFSYRF